MQGVPVKARTEPQPSSAVRFTAAFKRSVAQEMRRGGLARLLRWATWPCVVVLAVLSATPGDEMVRTGAPGFLEHLAGYAGAAGVAALGYGQRVSYCLIGALLIAYAGLLEVGQLWVPGRTSRALDFAFSSAGVITAVAAAWFWSPRATADVRGATANQPPRP
jgi:VanZ family protein